MATVKKHFYVAKGKNDNYPWVYYGEEPPRILENGRSCGTSNNILVGGFENNPIADSIKDNEIVKIYIRKETKQNK